MKATRDTWSLPPLQPILATCPVLYLVLLSRSSSGAKIKQEVYDNLLKTVNENKKAILNFMKNKFDLDFEVHVIDECGINGSILSVINDCTRHVRGTELGQHLPGSHIADIFSYYYRENCAVGIVTTAPGDFTGKLSNHAHFLNQLKKSGIPPEKVIYISHGVEISVGTEGMGVITNFTIFSGDEMMQRIRFHTAEESEDIPDRTLPNVDGYISGMTKDATSRLMRNLNERKVHGGERL